MKLSIVIVNYNVEHFLDQCLQSVYKALAKGPNDAEVFVVDNNSVDGSMKMVKEKFPQAILIENKENLGFSKANNQAIKIAKGEYVLLLNPDTVVQEDTFTKVTEFMDSHPDAGGLGVKMIDGKGKFLPESKRGLPTPWVAFYKIFGLSALFSKSKKFGRYHLGYLDKDKNHEIDVLSGAFMLMRKTALDKVGMLDETFFMYGEDIDLSYRITQGGFKNYYFSDTTIIHYKGESTKKSSVNYVFVFYKAMVIFAKKHFSQRNAGIFSFLIHLAIYLRAGIAVGVRIIKKLTIPLLDSAAMFGLLLLTKNYWEANHKYIEGGSYPPEFLQFIVPAYILTWIISMAVSGAYERPYKIMKVLRGMFVGSIFILVIYALLPESYRFSRAIILVGAAISTLAVLVLRLLGHLYFYKKLSFDPVATKRIIIAGDKEECVRVEALIRTTQQQPNIIGYVFPEADDQHPKYLGYTDQLQEVVKIYQATEIIFCAKNIPADSIMQTMSGSSTEIEYKIAPPESEFIIGSNSINTRGELYVVDLNSINRANNKRRKRFLDISTSLLLLSFIPITFWLPKNKGGFIRNIFSTLFGKKTWISYSNPHSNLPKLRSGILTPADGIKGITSNELTKEKLDVLYAKDYRTKIDLNIILKSLSKLGN